MKRIDISKDNAKIVLFMKSCWAKKSLYIYIKV